MATTPLFRFRHGDHICVFYEDETTLLDFLLPYFIDGLRLNERCFTAQPESIATGLKARLTRAGFDVPLEIARGALHIHTLEEVYGDRAATSFDPVTMITMLKQFIAASITGGFTGTRMAGEMEFIVKNNIECNQLLEYERLVEDEFPSRPAVGICQYNTSLFTPETLERVIAVHRHTLTRVRPDSERASLAIRRGRYVLDIVAHREDPLRFYYVAQEHGKRDILGWGVEPSFDDAMWQGESLLKSLGQSAD